MANCDRRVPMLTTLGSCEDAIAEFRFEGDLQELATCLRIEVQEKGRCRDWSLGGKVRSFSEMRLLYHYLFLTFSKKGILAKSLSQTVDEVNVWETKFRGVGVSHSSTRLC